MNIKIKQNKGYSLIELIVVIAFIMIALAVVYTVSKSKYDKAKGTDQVNQLMRIKDHIGSSSAIVSVNNSAQGLTILQDIASANHLINSGMIPDSEREGNQIKNVFKSGYLTFSSKVMNVLPSGQTLNVPVFSINIDKIPKKSCGYMFGEYMSKEFVEIKVNNVIIKSPDLIYNPVLAASSCELGSDEYANLEFTESAIYGRDKYGDAVVRLSGAVGKYVDEFDPKFRRTIAVGGSGVAATCTGGSVNTGNGNYCSCPAGTMLQGDRCEAIGSPGVCLPGYGWNLNTNVCEVLTRAPAKGLAQVQGVYENGQYVPEFLRGKTQKESYHTALGCNGVKRDSTASPWKDVQNNIHGGSSSNAVGGDRYTESGGQNCGVCVSGEVMNAQGRCTSIKQR
jgi:hypothetical protein